MDLSKTDEDYLAHRMDESRTSFYHLAYSILNNSADAEDAVSEAIYKMWKNRNSLSDWDKLDGWMFTIVKNTAKNQLRQREKMIPSENCSLIPEIRNEPEDNIWSLMEKLSEKKRLVLYLYYYAEKSQKEIAEVLHIPVGTVKSRLRKAKSELKNILKENGYF